MKNIIKRFEIKGLYRERNVRIDFEDNIKILVAENGCGKTIVLNTLFYVLFNKFDKLKEVDFEIIIIEFYDNEEFLIAKDDISIKVLEIYETNVYRNIAARIGDFEAEKLVNSFFTTPTDTLRKSNQFKNAVVNASMPEVVLLKMLFSMKDDYVNDSLENLKKIRNKFPCNPLYLPTYRRVERDFKYMSASYDIDSTNRSNIKNIDDYLINFGMKDVKKIFIEVMDDIKTSSNEWFSKVNGNMLSQLITGMNVDEKMMERIRNPEAIKIVLDRIGDNIDDEYKKEIIRLIEDEEIFEGYDPLIYFISNLVKVYEKQKENDRAIQEFSNVCNKYFVDKKIVYNESRIEIKIVRRRNGREIDIERLSSGEKHIIALFARLYLTKEDNLAIFYDEPELSLSIEWQKKLLPDIINSGKCAFMFATTHSPFIFQNELISNTVDLREYIEEL